MVSTVTIIIILLIIYKRKTAFKADFKRNIGSIDKRPRDLEEYIGYVSIKFDNNLRGAKFFFWLIYSVGLFLISCWPELAVVKLFDIKIDTTLSIVCYYAGVYGSPVIGALLLVNMHKITEPKIKLIHNKVKQYISWMPNDRTLLAVDGFFGNVIIEGSTSSERLDAVRNFRDRCYRDGTFDITEAELYLKSVNALRKSKNMGPAYEDLFRRIKIEKIINDIKAAPENIEDETAGSTEVALQEQLVQQTKDLLFEIFSYDRIVKKMDPAGLPEFVKGFQKLYPEKANYKKIAGLFTGLYIAEGVFTRSDIEEIASIINGAETELIFDENYTSLFDDYEWKIHVDKGKNSYRRRRRSYRGDDIIFEGNDMYDYNGEFIDY